MPEGDTVWLVAQRLHQALGGDVATTVDLRVPRYATADLSGRTVVEVVPRGKHLLTRFAGSLTLHTHLRMEGSWRLFRAGETWRGGTAAQIRAVVTTARWAAVGYRLGIVEVVPTDEEGRAVGHLGPDLLGPEWNTAVAVERLQRRPDQEIGVALLDQRNLAGIGTLYRAETLFLRGVHPRTPVGAVSDLAALVTLSRRLLRANRERPEQSTTGSTRRGEQHWVFGRASRPCRRFGTPVRTAEQGEPPRARPVFWCPRCQPAFEAR
jgi:endonuclease-8